MKSPAAIAAAENNAVARPADILLPDSAAAGVEPTTPQGNVPTLAERLAPFIGIGKDLPPDLAANHDHYLHGAPKQQP